jgi:hypothetical protein
MCKVYALFYECWSLNDATDVTTDSQKALSDGEVKYRHKQTHSSHCVNADACACTGAEKSAPEIR